MDIPTSRELDNKLQEYPKLTSQEKPHNVNTYIMRTYSKSSDSERQATIQCTSAIKPFGVMFGA